MKQDHQPRVLYYVAWVAALACLALIARRARPARLRSAQVTAVLPGDPPVASVALAYGGGLPPISAIIDVRGRAGGGSATVEGQQRFVELPLAGPPEPAYDVSVTTYYRVLGALRSDTRVFPGPAAPAQHAATV